MKKDCGFYVFDRLCLHPTSKTEQCNRSHYGRKRCPLYEPSEVEEEPKEPDYDAIAKEEQMFDEEQAGA